MNVSEDGVLVLDSDTQCSIAVIRSLGRKGVTVTAGGSSRWSLGMHSKYSDGSYVHPDPAEDYTAFVDHLVEYLDGADYSVVLPVTDHTSLILSQHKDRIEGTGTTVGVEDWQTFETAFDKAKLAQVLGSVDVPAPGTYAPESIGEVDEIADDIDYPVVIKPRSKSLLRDTSYSVSLVGDDNYVDSPQDLLWTYCRLVGENEYRNDEYPLVQERIEGTTTTTVALAKDGEIRSYFQEKRLRTYPASGGNSALLAAVREPRMLEYTERVLDRLDWSGPVMVEFMETPDGEFYVIEVNGRYWGSMPFAISCGVDFPWLHYLQLQDMDLSPLTDFGEYRTDIVQRRLLYEDIKWLGENLSEGSVGALVPFVRDFARTNLTFFEPADPVPTIGSVVQGFYLGANSLVDRALQ